MKIAFGTTIWFRCAHHNGHIDGIGVYTKSLWEQFTNNSSADKDNFIPAYFGNKDASQIEGSVHLGGSFPEYLIKSSLGISKLTSEDTGGADLFHATDHNIPIVKDIPVVSTVMDLIPYVHPEYLNSGLKALKRLMFKRTVLTSDHIITISEHSKRDIVKYFDVSPGDVSVIPLGVDESYFHRYSDLELNNIRNKYALNKGFFLFVGTFQPRKNIDRIIRAYSSLPDHVKKDFDLVLVGREGWGVDYLFDDIARSESIKWLRYVPEVDAIKILQLAEALVFPSLYEGFGLPVLEAFASECPVITSNTTSLPEVAQGAANLVDPLDVESIRNSMESIIDDPAQREDMIRMGKEVALSHSWKSTALKTLRVYEQVLKKC